MSEGSSFMLGVKVRPGLLRRAEMENSMAWEKKWCVSGDLANISLLIHIIKVHYLVIILFLFAQTVKTILLLNLLKFCLYFRSAPLAIKLFQPR